MTIVPVALIEYVSFIVLNCFLVQMHSFCTFFMMLGLSLWILFFYFTQLAYCLVPPKISNITPEIKSILKI